MQRIKGKVTINADRMFTVQLPADVQMGECDFELILNSRSVCDLSSCIKKLWYNYKSFNQCWTSISGISAIVSLGCGICYQSKNFPSWLVIPSWLAIPSWVAMIIIGLWVILPPVYLWVDWVVYSDSSDFTKEDKDNIKHTHDLARNIWLALVVLLGGLFNITIFK